MTTVFHYLEMRQQGLTKGSRFQRSSKAVDLLLDEEAARPLFNQLCEFSGEPRSTFLMDFSPNKSRVASTHGDHTVRVTDVQTGKCTHVLTGHPRTPWSIAFHPVSDDILASGCLSGEVRIWDLLGGGSEVLQNPCGRAVVTSLSFHPSEHILAFSSTNKIHFWDWSKPQPFATTCTENTVQRVRWVKFDHFGEHLFTGIANDSTPEEDLCFYAENSDEDHAESVGDEEPGASSRPLPLLSRYAPRYQPMLERLQHLTQNRPPRDYPASHGARSPFHEYNLTQARQYAAHISNIRGNRPSLRPEEREERGDSLDEDSQVNIEDSEDEAYGRATRRVNQLRYEQVLQRFRSLQQHRRSRAVRGSRSSGSPAREYNLAQARQYVALVGRSRDNEPVVRPRERSANLSGPAERPREEGSDPTQRQEEGEDGSGIASQLRRRWGRYQPSFFGRDRDGSATRPPGTANTDNNNASSEDRNNNSNNNNFNFGHGQYSGYNPSLPRPSLLERLRAAPPMRENPPEVPRPLRGEDPEWHHAPPSSLPAQADPPAPRDSLEDNEFEILPVDQGSVEQGVTEHVRHQQSLQAMITEQQTALRNLIQQYCAGVSNRASDVPTSQADTANPSGGQTTDLESHTPAPSTSSTSRASDQLSEVLEAKSSAQLPKSSDTKEDVPKDKQSSVESQQLGSKDEHKLVPESCKHDQSQEGLQESLHLITKNERGREPEDQPFSDAKVEQEQKPEEQRSSCVQVESMQKQIKTGQSTHPKEEDVQIFEQTHKPSSSTDGHGQSSGILSQTSHKACEPNQEIISSEPHPTSFTLQSETPQPTQEHNSEIHPALPTEAESASTSHEIPSTDNSCDNDSGTLPQYRVPYSNDCCDRVFSDRQRRILSRALRLPADANPSLRARSRINRGESLLRRTGFSGASLPGNPLNHRRRELHDPHLIQRRDYLRRVSNRGIRMSEALRRAIDPCERFSRSIDGGFPSDGTEESVGSSRTIHLPRFSLDSASNEMNPTRASNSLGLFSRATFPPEDEPDVNEVDSVAPDSLDEPLPCLPPSMAELYPSRVPTTLSPPPMMSVTSAACLLLSLTSSDSTASSTSGTSTVASDRVSQAPSELPTSVSTAAGRITSLTTSLTAPGGERDPPSSSPLTQRSAATRSLLSDRGDSETSQSLNLPSRLGSRPSAFSAVLSGSSNQSSVSSSTQSSHRGRARRPMLWDRRRLSEDESGSSSETAAPVPDEFVFNSGRPRSARSFSAQVARDRSPNTTSSSSSSFARSSQSARRLQDAQDRLEQTVQMLREVQSSVGRLTPFLQALNSDHVTEYFEQRVSELYQRITALEQNYRLSRLQEDRLRSRLRRVRGIGRQPPQASEERERPVRRRHREYCRSPTTAWSRIHGSDGSFRTIRWVDLRNRRENLSSRSSERSDERPQESQLMRCLRQPTTTTSSGASSQNQSSGSTTGQSSASWPPATVTIQSERRESSSLAASSSPPREQSSWQRMRHIYLHPHYSHSILDDTLNRPSIVSHNLMNHTIAQAFLNRDAYAVASNIIPDTHRIQRWDLRESLVPDISDSQANVIVAHCKLHNDASCDISQDGTLLAAIVPSLRGFPDSNILAVFSLKKESLGNCLYTKKFGPNAISVSLSPGNQFILVGLASKRVFYFPSQTVMVAQVYRLAKQKAGENSMELVTDLIHPNREPRMHVSVNSSRFLPGLGEGLVYGTTRGDLHFCRPVPHKTLDTDWNWMLLNNLDTFS